MFTIMQLVGMLRGIASGMRYLSDMGYVHRVCFDSLTYLVNIFCHWHYDTGIFADHFSGPGTAISRLCVCVDPDSKFWTRLPLC